MGIVEAMTLAIFLIALRNVHAAEIICSMCSGPANLTLSIGLSFFLYLTLPIK